MQELTITANKFDLIGRIQNNRDKHRNIFEKAVTGFREQVIAQLEARLEMIRNGRKVDLSIRLPEPEDHTEDYDRVLDMLEMHRGDTIDISNDEFAMYVRDDWAWKRNWIAGVSNYTKVG